MAPNDRDRLSEASSLCPPLRYGLLAFGWVNVALGVVGALLPLMPTTVFLLIALWAFSMSAPRFHLWLYSHPRWGGTLRAWHEHQAIPLRAKVLACSTMGASLLLVVFFSSGRWELPLGLALLFAVIAGYIVTRPHALPAATERP